MKMFLHQKIVVLIFCNIFCFVAGCANRQENSGKVKLILAYGSSVEEEERYAKLANDFEKKYPNITVKLIGIGGLYYDKIQTMMAGGTPPDVMWMGREFFNFAMRGAFLDIDPYIKSAPNLVLSKYYQKVLEFYKINGKLYGFPYGIDVGCLFYNKSLFDKTGVSYPDNSWTWDTMLDAAKKLTLDTDGDGKIDQFGIGNFREWAVIWSNGGDVLSDDYTKSLLAEPPAVEAFEFMVDLEKKYKVSPYHTVDPQRQTAGADDLFQGGKVAMLHSFTWMVLIFRKTCNFKWDIAILPKNKVRTHWMSTAGHAVSSKTKHPEEAWLLLEFLSSKDAQIMVMDSTVPTLIELNESKEYRSPLPPEHWHIFVDAIQTARSNHRVPNLREIESVMTDTLDSAREGKESVRKYCIDGAKRIEKLLSETKGDY